MSTPGSTSAYTAVDPSSTGFGSRTPGKPDPSCTERPDLFVYDTNAVSSPPPDSRKAPGTATGATEPSPCTDKEVSTSRQPSPAGSAGSANRTAPVSSDSTKPDGNTHDRDDGVRAVNTSTR